MWDPVLGSCAISTGVVQRVEVAFPLSTVLYEGAQLCFVVKSPYYKTFLNNRSPPFGTMVYGGNLNDHLF